MEPADRKALITQLSSPEEEERRLAMEKLKEDLSETDLDWLTRPLSDESWRVRKEGIEGLSKLPVSPQLVGALVPLMHPEKELTLRNSIVEVLERIGHEVAPLLLDYLDIDQTDVRKFLVDILGNIAHPGSVPSLLGLLHDPEDNIKAAAAEALASIGDPSVCEGLLTAMEGADDWVIYSILGTLARLGCPDALPVFFEYLENHLLSRPALSGIGAMGSSVDGIRLMELIPTLSKGAAKAAFLASGSIYRRYVSREDPAGALELSEAVYRAVDEELLHSLISQLEITDDLEERKDILAALGMSGSENALNPILRFVEDDAVAMDVDLALMTLGKRNAEYITGLLKYHDPLVRQRGIRTLERMNCVESLEDLYRLLNDENGHVRKDAVIALSSLGDSSSIDKLLPVLEDEYNDVAQAAAQALVRLGQGSPEDLAIKIVPLLQNAAIPLFTLLLMILTEVQAANWEDLCLKAAQDIEPQVRAVAVSCLKRSDKSAAIATIINALADENPHVRAQAVVTLEELKHPEAIAPLKAALHDQDPWVRSAAVSALSAQPQAVPADFEELLTNEDLMMQTSALDALGKMAADGDNDAVKLLEEQFVSGGLEIRRSICRLLANIRDPRAFDLLVKALEDVDAGIRVFAVQALSHRQEDQIEDILRNTGEKETDKQVREAIRTALEGRK